MLCFRQPNSRAAAAAVLLSGVLLGGCDALDRLMGVKIPSRIAASDLESPASAGLLVRSTANEFRCAFPHYVNVSGMVGSELAIPQNTASMVFFDQRRWTTSGFPASYASNDCQNVNPALYLPLSRARWMADDVLNRLEAWGTAQVPNKAALEAEVAAYAGYSYVMLGESMCSVAFDEGPEQSVADAFALAVARFDRAAAAAQAANSTRFLNLARIGKARALLNLNRPADAAQVAALVPRGFEFTVAYASISEETFNKVHTLNHRDHNATVEEPYRNLSFGGVADPRVRVTNTGRIGPGSGLPIWTADKYSRIDSPIQLATWHEAQLIMAEAAVVAGRLQDAVAIINVLHDEAGLPRFASSNAAEIMAQIVYERRAELFLEGHHLMDLKRYELPLTPAAGALFPFGGSYGDLTCFPLPAVEFQNNPHIERTF